MSSDERTTLRVIFLYGALAVAASYGLHRAALWAEGRGWLYYRDQKPPPGASAHAANTLAALIQPEIGHVLEVETLLVEDGHDGA